MLAPLFRPWRRRRTRCQRQKPFDAWDKSSRQVKSNQLSRRPCQPEFVNRVRVWPPLVYDISAWRLHPPCLRLRVHRYAGRHCGYLPEAVAALAPRRGTGPGASTSKPASGTPWPGWIDGRLSRDPDTSMRPAGPAMIPSLVRSTSPRQTTREYLAHPAKHSGLALQGHHRVQPTLNYR